MYDGQFAFITLLGVALYYKSLCPEPKFSVFYIVDFISRNVKGSHISNQLEREYSRCWSYLVVFIF